MNLFTNYLPSNWFLFQTAKRKGLRGRYIPSSRPPLANKFTSKFGYHGNNTNKVNNNNKPDAPSLDVITNEIFGNLMLDKSDQLLAHNFDDLGILDPDGSPKVSSAVATDVWCVSRYFGCRYI